jgi:hypothetical protein
MPDRADSSWQETLPRGEFVRVHAPVSRSLPPLVDEPELGKDLVAGVERRRQFASTVDEFAFLNLGAP